MAAPGWVFKGTSSAWVQSVCRSSSPRHHFSELTSSSKPPSNSHLLSQVLFESSPSESTMSRNPLPKERKNAVSPLEGPLQKRSWGEMFSEQITGANFGFGMNEDDNQRLKLRLQGALETEKSVNTNAPALSTYLFCRYDKHGHLLDAGEQCAQICGFFFSIRPPNKDGIPWNVSTAHTPGCRLEPFAFTSGLLLTMGN